MARIKSVVSVSGASACENRYSLASCNSSHFGEHFAGQPLRQGAERIDVGLSSNSWRGA